MPSSPTERSHDYLLLSDVHLGADLVQHVRPWTVDKLRQVARIDRELSAMLDWYREHRDPDRPWKLVVAGDLVDFIGMSIAPLPEHEADLTDEERQNGLGSTAAHAAAKMRAVARRHESVFGRLAAFLADGHSLVLVRGNHDVDFHWEDARRAFIEAIVERLPEGPGPGDRAAVAERVEFHPWFYYDEGLLYVEHGHQFDAMCSYHHLLNPVSPRDPRRISWSFSDILLRRVVRPTPGVGSEGHDGRSMVYYVKLGFAMGFGGAWQLFVRFVSSIADALRRWRGHLSEGAKVLRDEHDRRLADLASQKGLGLDRVRALAALWPAPITRGAIAVLRSMFVDRVLLGTLLAAFVGVLVWLLAVEHSLPLAAIALGLAVTWVVVSKRYRARDVDPEDAMRIAARRIAELVETRFVVMGHTHLPIVASAGAGATYVNLGAWAVDEVDAGAPEAPRTHLVLRLVDGDFLGELRRWCSEANEPIALVSAPATAGSWRPPR